MIEIPDKIPDAARTASTLIHQILVDSDLDSHAALCVLSAQMETILESMSTKERLGAIGMIVSIICASQKDFYKNAYEKAE